MPRIGINQLEKIMRDSFPDVVVEIVPSYDDMLFLYRLGSANWNLWAGSLRFQRLIHDHGSPEDQQRIRALNVGYPW